MSTTGPVLLMTGVFIAVIGFWAYWQVHKPWGARTTEDPLTHLFRLVFGRMGLLITALVCWLLGAIIGLVGLIWMTANLLS